MRLGAEQGQRMWRCIRFAVGYSRIPPPLRHTASLYLLSTGCNLPGALIAEVLGCSRQNVSQVLREVEDRRDIPEFDAELTRLERELIGA